MLQSTILYTVEAYFKHANFSHGDLLDDRIFLGLKELLDGHADARFFIATLKDHAVSAFSQRCMPLVLVHCYTGLKHRQTL